MPHSTEISADELKVLLRARSACSEALEWADGKTFAEAWTSCERPDWMLWIAGRMCETPGWWTRQEFVLAACACAETVLPIFEKKYPDDKRPRKAIETARLSAEGKASIKDVRTAAYAAYAADDAATANAAYAAAYAASSAAAASSSAAAAYAAAAYAAYRRRLRRRRHRRRL